MLLFFQSYLRLELWQPPDIFWVNYSIVFLRSRDFDWITISIVTPCSGAQYFLFWGSLIQFNKPNGSRKKEGNTAEAVKQDRDVSVSGILITLGVWFILVPLLIWIRSLIIPYQ
jgi:hypothetical protein